jgi:hypothetical protein
VIRRGHSRNAGARELALSRRRGETLAQAALAPVVVKLLVASRGVEASSRLVADEYGQAEFIDAGASEELFQRGQHRPAIPSPAKGLGNGDLFQEDAFWGLIVDRSDPEPAYTAAGGVQRRPQLMALLGSLGELTDEHRRQLRTCLL